VVKCPWCGKDIPAEEYGKHYETCPKRTQATRAVPLSAYMLVSPLTRMKETVQRRDFDTLLRQGMEVLVDIGKFYEMAGIIGLEALYNNVAIALLSAYKGDWGAAENFIQKAIEHAQRGVPTP